MCVTAISACRLFRQVSFCMADHNPPISLKIHIYQHRPHYNSKEKKLPYSYQVILKEFKKFLNINFL